ncbi:hypothetical protein QL285_032439 [Trifolium repens]|nr:hypothetical protein QL285_032439 [Trifolium repens]
MNVEFKTFNSFPLRWNSTMKHIMSACISDQKFLIKPKLIPSGPELLKLLQSQTALFTSFTEKCLVKLPPSKVVVLLNWRLSTPGLSIELALKWETKCERTACRIGCTPSEVTPST